MKIVALVMAGGRASRMNFVEKPMLRIAGKTMIEMVIEALKKSKKIEKIIVAVTENTPKTAKKVRELGIKIVKTPGHGFIEDTKFVIKKLNLRFVLIVAADLPLLKSELIDEFIEQFERRDKRAYCLVVPLEKYEKIGFKPNYILKDGGHYVVPVGINIVDGMKIDEPELPQENFLTENIKDVINVNTPKELELAMKLLEDLK